MEIYFFISTSHRPLDYFFIFFYLQIELPWTNSPKSMYFTVVAAEFATHTSKIFWNYIYVSFLYPYTHYAAPPYHFY